MYTIQLVKKNFGPSAYHDSVSRFLFLFCLALYAADAQNDWPTFGHDAAGTRYSPLSQINTANVTTLQRAWTFHMTPAGADVAVARVSESTPLMVNGKLYLTTPYHQVVALEPETGKLLWAYDLPRS